MSPLERLGLEVCAYQLLGSRGHAALLLALIKAGGAAVSYESLQQARAWKMPRFEDVPSYRGVQIRTCRLREAMEDVGLGGLIQTMPGGYALPEPGRSKVLARLVEEAA